MKRKPAPRLTTAAKPAKPKPVAKPRRQLKPATQIRATAQPKPVAKTTLPKPKLKIISQGMGGWFRPYCDERHPDFHVHRYGNGYVVKMLWKKQQIEERFSAREFGSLQHAKFAAVEFARGAVKNLKDYRPRGWRLGIKRAGNVVFYEQKSSAIAVLQYNGEQFCRWFSYGPRSGRSRDQAEAEARSALAGFRADLLRREREGKLGYDWFSEG